MNGHGSEMNGHTNEEKKVDLLLAKDAAEAVTLDIEPLPAVVNARDAAKPGAPQVWDDVPDNIGFLWKRGDGTVMLVPGAPGHGAHRRKQA